MRWILAALAISYLFVMAYHDMLHGHNSDPHTHNQDHSDGLISVEIAQVSRIVIRKDKREWPLLLENSEWKYESETLSGEHLNLLRELLSMLTGAEPVRTFLPEDLAHVSGDDDGAEYGLAEPKLQVSVFAGHKQKKGAKPQVLVFGHATPDGSLRYARKAGDPALYVMSGFVYEQVEMLVKALANGLEN